MKWRCGPYSAQQIRSVYLLRIGTACLWVSLSTVGLLKGQGIEWTEVNDGLWGGGIKKILPAPEGLLYALTYHGGFSSDRIYRSRDEGLLWQALDTGSPDTSVAHLVVFPDGELIASTYGGGLLRSTDQGDSWTTIAADYRLAAGLALHPSGVLFGANYLDSGILRSLDRGVSWQATALTDSTSWISDIDVTPFGTVLVASDDDVFRSDDLGDTWSKTSFEGSNLTRITVTTDSSVFLLLGPPRDTQNCMYRSLDDGVTWLGFRCHYDDTSSSDQWVHGVAVTTSGTLILGEFWRIRVSTDGGSSWPIRSDLRGSSITDDSMVIHNGTIYVGSWATGILVSEDDGETWNRRNNGIGAATVSVIRTHSDASLYTMVRDDGLFHSEDHGGTWDRLHLDQDSWLSSSSSLAFSSEGDIFLASGDIFRSSDRGESWKRMHSSCFGERVVFSPNGTLYTLGYNELYRLDEARGRCDVVTTQLRAIRDLAFANNGDLLVATASGADYEHDGVFRSSDDGATWQAMPMSPFNKSIYRILVKPNGVVIAGPMRSGIYRSTDDGYSFEAIWEPPYVGYVRDFALGPAGEIYAATLGGIYRSKDDGSNWEEVGRELPEDRILTVSFDAAGHLYVGTDGAGAYRSVHPIAVSREGIEIETPNLSRLSTAYPNPFTTSTTIRFGIDKAEVVRLTIHLVTGRQLAVVTDRLYPPGNHEIVWDAEGVSSGIYLYRLDIGEKVVSGSLIIAR